MNRDLAATAATTYDLLLIGGGIYGSCVAWDAAQRGLSVALVERAEFGMATSANSLKTLHGGLRYLQEANLPRMRLMIRERRAWMRIAPHLIRPLPFLLPTIGKSSRHKLLMRVALWINDWVSFDRNRGVAADRRLPGGRILSRAELLARVPGLPAQPFTGGALWHDAQLIDSEALLALILEAAVSEGARIANHAPVVGFLREDGRIVGATVTDKLHGGQHEIRARLVVNCAGGWSDGLLATLNGRDEDRAIAPTFQLSTAMNLVTRQILPDTAVGLPRRYADGREQILFIVPWQDCSIVGTWHAPYDNPAPTYQPDEATIANCLADINAIYPPARLTPADIRQTQVGYLPAQSAADNPPRLVRESEIYDHAPRDGLEGLISVIGVKYTTARQTAEQAVDLALRKLGRPFIRGRTAQTCLTPPQRGNLSQS
jgi:glycerol-3-phosphate dehydrogenase